MNAIELNSIPIFVTGCKRSGLSMTCSILHLHGVWSGEVVAKKIHKMTFSNWNFVKKILDSEIGDNEKIRKKFLLNLISRGYRGEGCWLVKGEELVFFKKQLDEIFPECIWIFTERAFDEILNSRLKTYPYKLLTEEKNKQDISRIQMEMEKYKCDKNVFVIHTSNFFRGNFSEIKKIIDMLELGWMGGVVKKLFEIKNEVTADATCNT